MQVKDSQFTPQMAWCTCNYAFENYELSQVFKKILQEDALKHISSEVYGEDKNNCDVNSIVSIENQYPSTSGPKIIPCRCISLL